jgi:protein TonB
MILRAPMAFGAAMLLTVSLFYGMQLLIAVGEMPVITDPAPKVIDTRIPEREIAPPDRTPPPVRQEIIEKPTIEKINPVITNPGQYIGDGIVAPKQTIEGPKIGVPQDRTAQPILRIEPNFQNITQREFITLTFDVAASGAVLRDSIVVLDSSSKRLHRPATRAVARWKYQPKVVNGEAVVQRDIRVAFTIQPPE